MKEVFDTLFAVIGAITGDPQQLAPKQPVPIQYAVPLPRQRPEALKRKMFIGPYELPPAHVQLTASRG